MFLVNEKLNLFYLINENIFKNNKIILNNIYASWGEYAEGSNA